MLIYRTTSPAGVIINQIYIDRTQNSSNSVFSVFQERGRFKRLKNKCSNEISQDLQKSRAQMQNNFIPQ